MTEEERIINIQRLSILFRGQIIQAFTRIEYLIDDIIKRLTFNSMEEYAFYTKLFRIKHIDGKTKCKILKHCLIKYDNKLNSDTSEIRKKIDNLFNTRHVLAHWQIDTSDIGIDYFYKKKKITYVKSNNGILENVYIDQKAITQLEKDCMFINIELAKIQNILSDSSSGER